MTDSSVTWNDERVEQLTKLWAEGRSASQIAAEIGGVSRNAVIGKVHRLGLSGRVKAPSATGPRSRDKADTLPRPASGQPVSRPAANASAHAAGRSSASPSGQPTAQSVSEAAGRPSIRPAAEPISVGATALAQPRLVEASPEQGAEAVMCPTPVAEVVHIAERVTIMDLRDGMCRWPIGDPTSPEFRFCGASAYTGVPYCEYHSQLAYQPSADRRREKKTVRG